MLITLTFIPIIGAYFLEYVSKNRVKQTSLAITIVQAWLGCILMSQFDSSTVGYQFVMGWSYSSFMHPVIGVDGLSILYILLTVMLTPICVLASWRNVRQSVKTYLQCLIVVEGLLVGVFSVIDLILFYVTFEAVLIPLFLMVGVWGGSPTRARSALLLFLYTLTGSLFMLVAIVNMRVTVGSTDFITVTEAAIDPEAQRLLWIGFFIALATKTPIVPVHIWLPRAHADAPLAGSMMLAGVVLKLATYGIVRVLLTMLPEASNEFAPFVQVLALISLLYASLATIRQVDMKALVAYSSIAHMAVVVIGLFSNTVLGITGALVLSLAHGVVSPALFMLVGGVLYDRYHTRSIRYYRGLTVIMPLMSTLFFLATAANIGVPLSGNWLSEVMSLAGAYQQAPIVGIVGASGIVLSACYSIWLWSRITSGAIAQHLGYTIDITRREFHTLVPLLATALWLGIIPQTVLDVFGSAITPIII